MKIISFINLKGGVGKSISAINFAYTLTARHGARVLLIDNDEQGNTSRFFDAQDHNPISIADVLLAREPYGPFALSRAIQPTDYERLFVLPADNSLLEANLQIMTDKERPQQTRLINALRALADAGEKDYTYDYIIIDNAPNLNMSTLNAIVASDDILIPVKIDKFAFDGLQRLRETVEDARRIKKAPIRIAGVFITMFQKNAANYAGLDYLKGYTGLRLFDTVIRRSYKVDESTYQGEPLLVYSRGSAAAKDYAALVDEYLTGAGKGA